MQENRLQKLKPEDVDRIVAKIDETRVAEHWRNPDRPDGKFVRSRGRQDPAIGRAKTRLRTAHYRNRLDQAKRPSNYQIGMSPVVALVTARMDELTDLDRSLVGKAPVDLQGGGFSVVEAKSMLRKLRNRMVDPADRKGEPGESTSAPIEPTAWARISPPF
jgi:hypothetical protein